jgi:ADP-ribose pyrophosphatase YjhB (NUDIX family)
MVTILTGPRIARHGRLAVGCSAAILDAARGKILLVRRADNNRWCVPGGYMEPGESFTEACGREVFEETGLRVRVGRLIGVYTTPHRLLVYPDGNRWQLVVLHFAAERVGGQTVAGDETTELGSFSLEETADLDMSPLDRLRVADAFAGQSAALVRDDFAI